MTTFGGPRSVCRLRWCHEVGEHYIHRRYVASLPCGRGGAFVGVNIAQAVGADHLDVEVTSTAPYTMPVMVLLEPTKIRPLAKALVHAASQAAGLSGQA